MKRILLTVSLLFALTGSIYSQSLTFTGSLQEARWLHESVLLDNGNVLAFGGDNGDLLNLVVHSSAQIYNVSTGVWSTTGSMNEVRSELASVKLANGNILAIGGDASSVDPIASCEIYDAVAGTWSYTDSMSQPRYDHAAIMLDNGKVLAAGGHGSGVSAELYDPALGTWSVAGDMTTTRGGGLSLTKLADGRILATGGSDSQITAEIYDPNTDTWSDIVDVMSAARENHHTLLLNNGQVLVTGSSTINSQNAVELFDPSNDSFTDSGDLQQNRGSCPTVLLNNGNVLIFGLGNFFDPFNTQCVETYNTSTGTWSSPIYNLVGTQGYTINRLNDGRVLLVAGSFTTGNGASATCWIADPSVTGIETGISDQSSVKAYPNPATNHVNIDLTGFGKTEVQLTVVDALGKQVVTQSINAQHNVINIETLKPGVYHYTITNSEGVVGSEDIVVR
ncbi:MAG: T9SS type A sorting domain-containing protein [Flavobacteriales bacterium]|nr:T9SS type A sorting domain-containing protein [Flavobacteriales bacterium]